MHVAGDRNTAGWLAALAFIRLRPALTYMHREPARAWSLADLAHATGMSRTAFAQRFKEKVRRTPVK